MTFINAHRNFIIRIITVIFLVAAIYHFVALFVHLNDLPLWRQTLFVFVDLFFALAINYLPGYFLFLFVLLLIEQLYSHGNRLINIWVERKEIDWLSLLVLLFLPLVFFFLFFDETFNRKREQMKGNR
ncbi:MAG: hypothetical protein ACTHJ5_14650 [Ilyomonas sp.]